MKKSKTKIRPTIFWAGICNDRLMIDSVDDHWGGRNERHAPSLFLTRREALKQFQEVRKVIVAEDQ